MNTLRFIILLCITLISANVYSQSGKLKVADKQFELYAYQAALQNYLVHLEADPSSTHSASRAGACYFQLNQPELAIGWLQKAMESKAIDLQSQFYLGQAYRMTGQYKEAANVFRSVGENEPVLGRHFENACNWALDNKTAKGTYKISTELINTAASEFGVTILNDIIVFNSFTTNVENAPVGWVAGDTYHYMYKSRLDGNGYLVPPGLLKKELQITPNDGPAAYSPDGKTVVFMRTQYAGKNRLTPEAGFQSSLFIADLQSNGLWDNVRPFPFNGAGYSCAWPSFNEDGTKFYFSSNKADGFGGMDIYMCHVAQQEWTEPVNLGGVINTAGNEITPLASGEHFYFASDWHTGFGGFDLFKAIKNQQKFVSVLNMGSELNSPGDDLGLVFSESPMKGYFVSNRKGKGDLDIYRFVTSWQSWPMQIMDAVSGKPVNGAVVAMASCGGTTLISDASGIIQVTMMELPPCKIAITHPQYAPTTVDARLLGISDGMFTVNLRPTAWLIPLNIVDSQTQKPLVDARLRITDQKTGHYQDYVTDEQGRIEIAMAPQSLYFINVAKEGYKHASKPVNTDLHPDKALLGTWTMEPVHPVVEVKPSDGVASAQDDKEKNLPSLSISERGVAFAIQVAAVNPKGNADVRIYESLSRFGTVYQKVGSTSIRIRVGLFEDRLEAGRIAKEIEKMGFPGAFVVQEQAESLLDRVMLSMAKTKPAVTVSSGTYLIRLAAYKNPKWFEVGELSRFGTIQDEISGEWTVKLITGIQSLVKAREAVNWARQNGFPEAYIIQEKEGTRQTVD